MFDTAIITQYDMTNLRDSLFNDAENLLLLHSIPIGHMGLLTRIAVVIRSRR